MSFAYLTIELEDPARGVPGKFQVPFNPTEFTRTKGAQIAEIAIPGLDAPILQFIRGQTEKLTLDLFFDTTVSKDGRQAIMGAGATPVTTETEKIYQLVKIQADTHAPPRLRLIWGKALSFRAIVESVQQKFTLFSPEGVPLRATLTVTFSEYKTLEQQLQEINKKSADHTKRRVVRQGDTLSKIAAEEYKDPGAWRHIAEENNIDNPRQLSPGMVLEIPPLDIFSTKTVKQQ
jgi:nucleoid-associated protein YgaU